MGDVMARHHQELTDKHPSVGRYRNIGLFGIAGPGEEPRDHGADVAVQLTNEVMARVNRFLLDNGLDTIRSIGGHVMTNPPLSITEEQMAEGFEIIDRALEIADAAVEA